jgi:hypothetical protein
MDRFQRIEYGSAWLRVASRRSPTVYVYVYVYVYEQISPK